MIPGNDDAIRAIQLYSNAASSAIEEGRRMAPKGGGGSVDMQGVKSAPAGQHIAEEEPEPTTPEQTEAEAQLVAEAAAAKLAGEAANDADKPAEAVAADAAAAPESTDSKT